MQIKVYVRTTEPWSHTLLDYLNSRQIAYTSVDVSVDRAAFDEMVLLSGQKRVPVMVVDERVIVGYKKHVLERLFG